MFKLGTSRPDFQPRQLPCPHPPVQAVVQPQLALPSSPALTSTEGNQDLGWGCLGCLACKMGLPPSCPASSLAVPVRP